MTPVAVHQVVSVLEPDDAVGDEVRTLCRALRRRGYRSEVFVALQRPGDEAATRPLDELVAGEAPAAVVYHVATASPATAALAASGFPLVVVYHDVTPPQWFWGIDRGHFAGCATALEELRQLRVVTRLAVAHSEYSRRDLDDLGFNATAVVPLALRPLPADAPGGPLHEEAAAAPTLLTVGRVAPNKCLEDCVRLLHVYRRGIDPRARLWIVGDDGRLPRYREAVAALVADLGETRWVRWLGRLATSDLRDCYAGCTVYLSMSEHEGFGAPLVEAMQAGLPVVAYDAGAVAETLGGAGVLLRAKHLRLAAELVARLAADTPWRRRCVAAGRRRAADLDGSRAADRFCDLLLDVGVPHASPP